MLADKLKQNLEGKIVFYNQKHILNGKYLSSYRMNNGENMSNGKCIPFFLDFSKHEFLKIVIGSNYYGSTFGEKMNALSDFYKVISEKHGEPTVFYTTKEMQDETLHLQWIFTNKKEKVRKMRCTI